MSYDSWKTTDPSDMEPEFPCKWEKFSGVCMVCGAGPDDECEIEREQRRAKHAARAIRAITGGFGDR